jgi:hypothetical protein
MKQQTTSISIITLFILLFSISLVYADIGPKPTVEISVYSNGNLVQGDFYQSMLQCSSRPAGFTCNESRLDVPCEIIDFSEYDAEKNCTWQWASMAWSQNICREGKCSFWYMPPTDFKLITYLPLTRKTFISNEVYRKSFNAQFKLDLAEDGTANLVETTPFMKTDIAKNILLVIVALALIIGAEVLIGLIFLAIAGTPKKRILKFVVFANLIALPVLVLIVAGINALGLIKGSNAIFWIIGLLLARAIFEAAFLKINNKENLGWIKASFLTVIMNIISTIAAIVLMMLVELGLMI